MSGTSPRPTDTLLGIDDVACRLNCSARHVRRLVETGQMPRPMRLRRLVRWRASAIDDWIDRGCPPADADERGEAS